MNNEDIPATEPTSEEQKLEYSIVHLLSQHNETLRTSLDNKITEYVIRHRIQRNLKAVSQQSFSQYAASTVDIAAISKAIAIAEGISNDDDIQNAAKEIRAQVTGLIHGGTKFPLMFRLLRIAEQLNCDVELVAQRMDRKTTAASKHSIKLDIANRPLEMLRDFMLELEQLSLDVTSKSSAKVVRDEYSGKDCQITKWSGVLKPSPCFETALANIQGRSAKDPQAVALKPSPAFQLATLGYSARDLQDVSHLLSRAAGAGHRLSIVLHAR